MKDTTGLFADPPVITATPLEGDQANMLIEPAP